MKGFIFTLAFACAAFGQSSTTQYSTDVNGYRVAEATAASSDSTTTQLSQSINGREVPLQSTQQRVLKNDSSGKTTETIVSKYDRNGQLISTGRILTQEQPTPGGGSIVHSTTYRTDINGVEQPEERSTSETQVNGKQTTTQTTIERPTINGTFDTTEKRTSVSTGTDGNQSATESVFRPNGNGGFYEAVRNVTEETKSGNTTVEKTAQYEIGSGGDLQLHNQSVSSTTKQPNGNETTQVDLYSAAAPGTVQQPGAQPEIKEEQVVSRQKRPDGSVVETLSVRRPSLADPRQLGSLQQLSETVCRGNCDAQPAQKPAANSKSAAGNSHP
ncbi:MAG TPA: hypothetical protein VFW83_09070 [Bryobacteraceae bacterium]|nr:hypothetical protein [Bryobacteraceae bacterium]